MIVLLSSHPVTWPTCRLQPHRLTQWRGMTENGPIRGEYAGAGLVYWSNLAVTHRGAAQ